MDTISKNTISDIRIDKCVKRLGYSEEDITTVFTIFNSYDKEGLQYITTDDLFTKLLQEERTAFGDALLGLIEIKVSEMITFGEYLDFVSMFCLFEEDNMLMLAFKMFDPTKSGFVDKDELRFFIYSQHNSDQSSNIERGLQYLEDNDDGDSRFEYYQIKDMHKNFPQLFYPVFRLQIQLQRNSGLGERWWELKKYEIIDGREARKKAAAAKEAADGHASANASEMAVEEQVKTRMGTLGYYGTPWRRQKVRVQLQRIEAINAELERQENEDMKNESKIDAK
jgi:Ca2+-binding EF-hand superfamily protein